MRVLIIGGTRFMGPHVISRLVAAGHSVTVFHRGKSKAALPQGANEMLGDRNSLADFAADFRRLRPDVLVDMMLLSQSQARQLMTVMTGVAGRLVVASSCDVYLQYDLLRGVEQEPQGEGLVDESSPLRRKLFPYRDSVPDASHELYDYDKTLVERTVMSSAGLPATVLRLPMVYGPGDYQHRFYGWVKRMLDRRPAIILERGQAEWRITRGYVENCAMAICRAVTDERGAGRIYNVGEPIAPAEGEWIERIAARLDWPGGIVSVAAEALPETMRSGMTWRHNLVVDTGRIRNELGFVEPVDPETCLARAVTWESDCPPQSYQDPFDYDAEDRILEAVL
jgi:nucleoside-diphosphate-sugar epimerase